jgi:glutathione S-transferase
MTRDRQVRLWHLPSSHYSEKVRWALDHKRIAHTRRTPLAVPHFVVARALTRGAVTTFPVVELPTGVVGDSTAIIAALEHAFPERPLYPADPAERARALELEDWFDENLGPSIRVLALGSVAHDPARLGQLAALHRPPGLRPQAWARTFGALIRKRYGTDRPGAAEKARDRVARAFDHLERSLGGRSHLVGGSFTVADLAAASHFYWLIQPPEGPRIVDRLPAPLAEFMSTFADRDGYRWVLEMYRRHRRPGAEADRERRRAVPGGVGRGQAV